MSSIKPGTYTMGEVLRLADFDFAKEAAADYLDGAPDYRRVQVAGLGFDSLDDKLVIPATADEVVVTLDGETSVTLDVDLSDEADQRERELAFSVSALDTKSE